MSRAERGLIRALFLDQPGEASRAALDRHVEPLARILRRSPHAIRRALHDERAMPERMATLASLARRVRKDAQFVAELLEQLLGMHKNIVRSGMSLPAPENMSQGLRQGAQQFSNAEPDRPPADVEHADTAGHEAAPPVPKSAATTRVFIGGVPVQTVDPAEPAADEAERPKVIIGVRPGANRGDRDLDEPKVA
jgi:hypothetical protein